MKRAIVIGDCDESLSVGFDGRLGVLEDACAGRKLSLSENRHILHISQVLAEGRQRVYWLFRRNGTNATARDWLLNDSERYNCQVCVGHRCHSVESLSPRNWQAVLLRYFR